MVPDDLYCDLFLVGRALQQIGQFFLLYSLKPRIVVKVGSSLLVNEDDLTIRYAFLHGLMADIAKLRREGADVVLTSSGAAAVGLSMMNVEPGKASLQDKQGAAACGQPLLLHAYKQVALEFGVDIAQVLLTSDDMENRRRYLNTKNTIERLIDNDILPIINENDTVTTEEIRVGDNDRLAARIAQMIQAQDFVMLTSIDGLYDKAPSDPEASFVPEVEDVSGYIEATTGVSSLGSGGMLTKMQAANMAQNAGVTTWIGEGILEAPISTILSGERRATKCIANGDPQSAFRLWMTDRLTMAGSLTVTKEAADKIRENSCGVRTADLVTVAGEFAKGDVLHVYDEEGTEVARGLTNFDAAQTLMIARHDEDQVAELLGFKTTGDVINLNNLVVLEERHLTWDAPCEEDDQIVQVDLAS
ncbi:glutamate 5-kinase [Parvularcula sp. ZS-1/3]|uniref:Glutamate 5-kinase n=1 Tax=Parvularcula mediterranea TaxID=2732508 RepID=A0A7Y3RQR3_9PROT|nr:glutamate 5-kinase [Parvularcula mediterranea]NNU17652.1 glutamate 5-kinase [Parvularcula mediterranea]